MLAAERQGVETWRVLGNRYGKGRSVSSDSDGDGQQGRPINLEPRLDKDALRVISVQPSEKMRLSVLSEVNYLNDAGDKYLGPDFDDCIQFDSLRSMAAEADKEFHYHYVETFKAWNVMRAQLGRPPYPWEKFLDRDEYDRSHGVRPQPPTGN